LSASDATIPGTSSVQLSERKKVRCSLSDTRQSTWSLYFHSSGSGRSEVQILPLPDQSFSQSLNRLLRLSIAAARSLSSSPVSSASCWRDSNLYFCGKGELNQSLPSQAVLQSRKFHLFPRRKHPKRQGEHDGSCCPTNNPQIQRNSEFIHYLLARRHMHDDGH